MMELLPSFKRCAMGDIIKLTYGKKNGLSYDEIEKNKSLYRADLIKLGNWGRAQDADYWLKKILEQDGDIMVTDVRVPHEYDVFKSAGAVSIRVEALRQTRMSRGKLVGEDDITEVGLDKVKDWDYVIENNSDYDCLKSNIIKIVSDLRLSFL